MSRSSKPQILTVVFVIILILILYRIVPGLLSSSDVKGEPKYVYKKAILPFEDEEIDPNDCKALNVKELMKGPMNQVDRRLLKLFRKYYLESPSTGPYNLVDGEGGPEEGMTDIVVELLDQKRDGFFIETRVKLADKSKSKFVSNTLHLEKEYGWSGVLIEPDKNMYELLKSKNRKAWLVPAMLSPNIYPQQVGFIPELNEITQEELMQIEGGQKHVDVQLVQAFPIVTIIAAVKVRKIDYLSLAVQNREYEILNTIPYEKVIVKVITVEHAHNMGVFLPIKTVMEGHGYIFVSSIIGDKSETSIYAHPSLFE